MEKILIDITDTDFAPTSAETYELVLLIGKEGVAYMTIDASRSVLSLRSATSIGNQPIGLGTVHKLLLDNKLQLPFGTVSIRFMHDLTTFVPNRLYHPDHLASYMSLLIDPKKRYHYFSQDVADFDFKLVFAVEEEVVQHLHRQFPGRSISHAAAQLLPVYRTFASPKFYEIFVNVFAGTMQVIVFDRQQMMLYNTYSFAAPADFLYFLMLPIDQLRLDPTNVRINITGELSEGDEIMRLAHRYFKNIHFLQFPAKYKLPGAIKALPSHFYFDLYHQK